MQPDKALSDGAQSLYPEQFAQLMDECSRIAEVVHRHIPRGIEVGGIEVTAHEGAAFPARAKRLRGARLAFAICAFAVRTDISGRLPQA